MLELFKAKIVEFAKANEPLKLEVLRFFISTIKNKEIELRPQGKLVDDDVVYKVLKKLLKQNAEALEMYATPGREEALQKATAEKAILEEFVTMFPADFLEKQAQIQAQIDEKIRNAKSSKA